MAHKLIGNKVVVDWETGDPEGDRINLLSAYRDFIKEVKDFTETGSDDATKLRMLFDEWRIDTENQIDDVPRIWIKRPER